MNGAAGVDRKPELNPVEKFEKAFQACLSVVTKEDTLSNLDHDELRVDTEHAIQELMEQAHAMEGYFLKKRLHIAHLKPELVLKDDTNELRLELIRKDELLKKNCEKMNQWQAILSDVQSVTTASVGGKTAGVTIGNPNQGAGMQQGPLTPGPGTPGQGRPQTPASVGRPQTPVAQGQGGPGQMQGGGPGGGRPGPGYTGQMPQQQGHPSGLQGPLAFLEKTASSAGGPRTGSNGFSFHDDDEFYVPVVVKNMPEEMKPVSTVIQLAPPPKNRSKSAKNKSAGVGPPVNYDLAVRVPKAGEAASTNDNIPAELYQPWKATTPKGNRKSRAKNKFVGSPEA